VTPREAALAADRAGLSVVPPREDGSKAPLGEWKTYQTRRPTPTQLRTWYSGARRGVGVVCGAVSGGLECLEFETEATYLAYLEAAEQAGLGELASRVEAAYLEQAPRGGRHWLYRCPEIAGNTKLAREPGPDGTITVLIETRGEGGYVVVAPSNGQVHPSGRPYQLLRGGFSSIATISPAERAELHRLARTLDRMPAPPPPHDAARPTTQIEGGRPGDDYNQRARWRDLLEPHGWTLAYRKGEVEHWRRPGKQHGISATTNHDGSGLLYVFSTSTTFEAERSYDPFGAYATLHYAGDLHAAAQALYADGYGEHLRHPGPPCARADCPNPPAGQTPEPPEDGWEPPTEAPVEAEPPKPLAVQPAGTKPRRPRPDTLVDGILQQGEMLVLGAARAIGKSWWGMSLSLMLALGHGLFMGALTVRRPARVLYCHGEIDDWAAYDRWTKLTASLGEPMPPGLLETYERWRIRVVNKRITSGFESTEFVDAVLDGRLEQTIVAHRIEVLVVDPWAVYYAGRENSNDEVEAALATLRDLQLRHGLTIVLLHHFGKANDVRDPEDLWRGASRLADWASTRVTLVPFYTPDQAKKQSMTRHQARRFATVRILRRSAAPPDDLAIKWSPETGQWERWRAPAGEGDPDLAASITPADVAAKCPPAGWPSITAARGTLGLNVSRAKVEVLLEQAGMQGLLEDFLGPRGARGWRVPKANQI